MRDIIPSKAFQKDLVTLRSNKIFNSKLLAQQIDTIASGGSLDISTKNHKMAKQSRAEYQGTMNFHHNSDIVVIYRLTDDALYLERIGNHSNLKLTRNKN